MATATRINKEATTEKRKQFKKIKQAFRTHMTVQGGEMVFKSYDDKKQMSTTLAYIDMEWNNYCTRVKKKRKVNIDKMKDDIKNKVKEYHKSLNQEAFLWYVEKILLDMYLVPKGYCDKEKVKNRFEADTPEQCALNVFRSVKGKNLKQHWILLQIRWTELLAKLTKK